MQDFQAYSYSVAEDVALKLAIEIAKAEGNYSEGKFTISREEIMTLFNLTLDMMKPKISRLR